jgi:WhiB family redox-sensing transcriptional regulator
MIDAFGPPEWTKLARCAEVDPELFFPEKGDVYSPMKARLICNSCEVKVECLEYALDNNEKYGVWGGLTERSRQILRRKRVA